MVKTQTNLKQRYLLLFILALASILFTGCDQGSLGTKSGTIQGYVLDQDTNAPISEVLVTANGTLTGANTEAGTNKKRTTYTDGDGSFVFGDVPQGSYQINVEKFGYIKTEENTTADASANTYTVANGENLTLSPIKMTKVASGTKGVLKGYPIDAVTGRALTNFTVTQETPYNERKSKTFDSAATFRDTGWTGLEGGEHSYSITANNYEKYSTENSDSGAAQPANPVVSTRATVSIGKSVCDLGTIRMQPLTISVGGTLRNVPGYILNQLDNSGLTVWAEAGGKVVATYTDFQSEGGAMKVGNINYTLPVPVTAGSVAVKCKLRGYDIITINSAVSIPSSNPGGILSGIDTDFSTIEPIKADVRIVFTGKEPEDQKPGTIKDGETLRAYIQAGGNDIVPYAECVAYHYGGEVIISGVITGYEINILAINMSRMYNNNGSDGKGLAITIPEGVEVYPVFVSFGD